MTKNCCKVIQHAAKALGFAVLAGARRARSYTLLRGRPLLVLVISFLSAGSIAAPKTFLGNEDYAPLLFQVDGQPAGLTVELAEAIFQAGKIDHKIELDNWSEAQARAKNKEVDGLLQINQSPARIEIFDFSDPVLQSEFSLFLASDNFEISQFAHLKQRRVGSEAKGYARAILERDPDIDIVIIDNWSAGFDMLKKGELDALLTEKWVGEYLLSSNRVQGIKVSPYPVELSTTHIAVAKGDVELLSAINEGIATIRANGTYDAILDKWRGETVVYTTEAALSNQRFITTLAIALSISFLLLLLLMTQVIRQKRSLSKQNTQLGCVMTSLEGKGRLLARSLTKERLNNRIQGLASHAAGIHAMVINRTSCEWQVDDGLPELLGYASKEEVFEAHRDPSAIHPDDRERVEAIRLDTDALKPKILADTDTDTDTDTDACRVSYTYRRLKPNGDVFWVRTAMEKVLLNDEEIRIITYQDVTDLIHTEAQLRSELAKQEQLFAIIGHELRTPASALKMLLAEQGVKALEPHGGLIDETVTHLLNVLDDMRIVTRPELVLESPEVRGSVPSVIERSLPLVGRLVVEKSLSVTVDTSPTAGVHCVLREQLLRQIVLNIVKNCALHAKASHLSLYIDAQDQGDEVFFTITFEDNGRGIKQEDQGKIFEAFGRGETESDGTGLGLHISRTYARNILKGDLTYTDSDKGGALFTLTAVFPKTSLKLENEERQRAKIDSVRFLEGLTILFAEDSPVLRMMTIKQLERQGAAVLAAEDGREALKRAHQETFDVVLTDIFMPNTDGYGLVAALRNEVGFKGPIIGVSAAVVGEEADKLLLAGANAVLPKPLNLSDLKAKVIENFGLIQGAVAKTARDGKPRVLVIDDDPITLGRFESFLEDDYEVMTEPNALKALADFKTFHPDVVFCDVNMPDMNGLEVLKGIQSFDPSIPIIQMSSTGAAKHYLNIAKTVGATEILNKNDDNETVLSLLRSVLERG